MVRTVAAAAAAVALVATATTTSQASSATPQVVSVTFTAFTVRGGASFHDNKDKKPLPKQRNKKKRRQAKNRREREEKIETTNDNVEEEEPLEHPPTNSKPSSQEMLIQDLLQQDDYYDILGVSKAATPQQIQKAYRKRAVQTHPDKVPNNDRRAFDKVAEAYDCLSDERKRATYNRFGKRGLDPTAEGRPPSSFTEDIFKSFFGSQFNNYRSAPPRNQTVRYQLEVTLEELYNGITKNVIVTEPGRKQVQVTIDRGMHSGQAIILSGEMDHVTDATPADLVFVIQQRPHSHFTRKGHDLAMELCVSLKEAVCGMTRTIRHLDGRSVTISSAKDDVHNIPVMIQTGDVHVLRGEGMPKPGERDSHGDLYVQYKVEMPTQEAISSLTSEERQQLSELLGKLERDQHKRQSSGMEDRNVRLMEKASPADFGRASGAFRVDTDDFEEEYVRPRGFPFGASRQFHFSSGGNFFGGAFGARQPDDFVDGDDGSDVQCQQM